MALVFSFAVFIRLTSILLSQNNNRRYQDIGAVFVQIAVFCAPTGRASWKIFFLSFTFLSNSTTIL